MDIELLSVGLVAGVLITLYFVGKRPVNVNVDVRAEAHGGNANSAGAEVYDSGSGGGGIFRGIVNFVKFLVIASIVFGVISLLGQKAEAPQVTVNVPKQDPAPITVNVPQQQPPVVNVPQQPAPIVNVPQQQPPVVNVPSGDISAGDGLAILLAVVIVLVIVVVGLVIVFGGGSSRSQTTSTTFQPSGYVKTSYGYSPTEYHGGKINGSASYPDLFKQNQDARK